MDQTEALTTIDVNTGGFVGTRNLDETIFKTNIWKRRRRLPASCGCAIWAASSSWTLSTCSATSTARGVLAELRKQLQRDRIKTTVGDFSQLGWWR